MHGIISLCLHYFSFPGRAGAIRDAFNIGGIDFEDAHVSFEQFGELRANDDLPFGGLPVLDVVTTDDKLRVAQSNTILRFAGRLTGLYPEDEAMRALKVDEVLDMCEDIYHLLTPTFHEPDNDRKMAMRKTLAEETLPRHAGYIERLLLENGNTGFLVGDGLTVADLKLYWLCEFLTNGSLDGIPTTLLDGFPTLIAWYKHIARVRENRLMVA